MNSKKAELLHEYSMSISPLCQFMTLVDDITGKPAPTNINNGQITYKCYRCGEKVERSNHYPGRIICPTCRGWKMAKNAKRYYKKFMKRYFDNQR